MWVSQAPEMTGTCVSGHSGVTPVITHISDHSHTHTHTGQISYLYGKCIHISVFYASFFVWFFLKALSV